MNNVELTIKIKLTEEQFEKIKKNVINEENIGTNELQQVQKFLELYLLMNIKNSDLLD